MMTIVKQLKELMTMMNVKELREILNNVLDRLEEAPEKEAIVGLLEACEVIDEHYKSYCEELEEQGGDEPGSLYKDGVSIEYYIEASWWHDVSVQLRKLRAGSSAG